MLTQEGIRRSERFIRAAFQASIFQPIDSARIVRDEPVVSLACGDFTQAEERHDFCRRRVAEKPQRIELHGGGLLLDPMNPENGFHNSLATIQRHVAIALKAKGDIRTMLSYVDWRCGVPMMHGMDAQQMFRSAIFGKRSALDTFLKGWEVRLLFYLHDYSFLDPEEFSFIKEHPEAKGFTFLYKGTAMEAFIDGWKDEVADGELVSR